MHHVARIHGPPVDVIEPYKELSLERGSRKRPKTLNPKYVAYPAWGLIERSIDSSYPVIAGISPDGKPDDAAQAEHAVLIIGYDEDYRGTGEAWVTLRDPYPYARGDSPYTRAGYSYDGATRKARLPWRALRNRFNLTSAVFLKSEIV